MSLSWKWWFSLCPWASQFRRSLEIVDLILPLLVRSSSFFPNSRESVFGFGHFDPNSGSLITKQDLALMNQTFTSNINQEWSISSIKYELDCTGSKRTHSGKFIPFVCKIDWPLRNQTSGCFQGLREDHKEDQQISFLVRDDSYWLGEVSLCKKQLRRCHTINGNNKTLWFRQASGWKWTIHLGPTGCWLSYKWPSYAEKQDR